MVCRAGLGSYSFSTLAHLEMYFSITGPDMGFIIISMGSAVLSQ